jgi:thiol-disulfide isomerase/thioredoxin
VAKEPKPPTPQLNKNPAQIAKSEQPSTPGQPTSKTPGMQQTKRVAAPRNSFDSGFLSGVESAVYTTASPAARDTPPPPVKPIAVADKALEKAEETARAGKLLEAAKMAEDLLSARPGDGRVLWLLARIEGALGQHYWAKGQKKESGPHRLKCAECMRTLHFAQNLDETQKRFYASALFNEACACGLSGDVEQAMVSLDGAFSLGFSDLGVLDSVDDLAALRDLPAFQQLAETNRKAIKARARESARQQLADFKPFPFSFSLEDMGGGKVSSGDYKGKLLVVDIWGTWCPFCCDEIPHFVRLVESYHSYGLEIVGINCGENGSVAQIRQKVQEFIKDQHVNYCCVIDDETTAEKVPGFHGYPTTLFVDRTGRVRLTIFGCHSYEKLEGIVTELLEKDSQRPVTQ